METLAWSSLEVIIYFICDYYHAEEPWRKTVCMSMCIIAQVLLDGVQEGWL